MKTDAQLKKDVIAELEWDPAIDATHVGVAVEDGVVQVTGHLGSLAEKGAVERAVQRVAGVRAVAVELDIRLAPEHSRDDAQIAAAIETAFRWHAQIPDDRVQVKVEKGWVTLTGEVDWDFQRHNADLVVRAVSGVRGLSNQATLRPREAPKYVADRIHDALVRYAEDEARGIEIEVRDGTAFLKGRVNAWAERSAAQWAALSAPGIARVVNEIEIAP